MCKQTSFWKEDLSSTLEYVCHQKFWKQTALRLLLLRWTVPYPGLSGLSLYPEHCPYIQTAKYASDSKTTYA